MILGRIERLGQWGFLRLMLILGSYILISQSAGATNLRKRLTNIESGRISHRNFPVDPSTTTNPFNLASLQRQHDVHPQTGHELKAGKITLTKVEHPHAHKESEGWGWGWRGENMGWGWGWEVKEHEEPHKETEGWGWKEEEKEEDELKKLIGVVGPIIFPLPFLLASLPLAIPAIGLTVLGKRRNITFQTLKPSENTGEAAAGGGEGRQRMYTILQQ